MAVDATANGAIPEGPTAAERTELLRFVTAGSVDDGKSTLIGRLLYESKQIFDDQLEHVRDVSLRRGEDELNLALLTDGLRAEREQGITIDVAYRYFSTPRRKFIIADTPGHVQYTRNMVTGASNADVALLLIDARRGVLEQSRRHAFIASLLRIPHIVVCVNKMDLVDYDEGVFERIQADFQGFSAKLEAADVMFIPVSATRGDNVVHRSEVMPWYEGPPLLYHLEHVHIASDRNLIDPRFPVQWVIRPSAGQAADYRGYAGQVAAGVFRVGDEVVVLPTGARTRLAGIESYDGPADEAFAPMSVTMHLEGEIDVSRGDMICRPHNQPRVGKDVEALVCWMNERPLDRGARYELRHTTQTARAMVDELRYRIDVNTLHREENLDQLALNEIGRVKIRTARPIAFDPYVRDRTMGSFILVDEATNDTVGAGMVMAANVEEPPRASPPNVTWHRGVVARSRRWAALGHVGATIWLTGLPASGKSTIAAALEASLVARGVPAYLLDGDNLRHGLCEDLSFDPGARTENVRRAAHVSRLFADAGVLAIASLISPYASDRALARAVHASDELPFLEIYVNTPLEQCESRDPKGLYARARRGELTGFTGVDAPYEAPAHPDLELRPVEQSVETMVGLVLEALAARGISVDG